MAQMPEFAFHLQNLENEIISILEDEDYKRIVKNKAVDLFRLSTKLAKDDNRYSIIQQGDAWTNNVMFKFQASIYFRNYFVLRLFQYFGGRAMTLAIDKKI